MKHEKSINDFSVATNETEKEKLTHHEIRKRFLSYFERNGHLLIPDSSLIPANDPTLLIINSGMAPIKKYFTGEEIPPSRRLTNIQRCVRTNDIESVGDTSHLTFFEMMGNWSIGDYFKKEALFFAYDFLTDNFHFDKNRLHVSVYRGDDKYPDIPADTEAYEIWLKLGVPKERIHLMGADDNFWGPAGTSGPCGPASEVYYDLGEDRGCGQGDCSPSHSCGRFLEIWNPGVFMQYNKLETGHFGRLPFNNVDAGAGMERFAMVLQGVKSVYDTDLLKPITEAFLQENFRTDGPQREVRIVTDHLRAISFMISDGIIPSNKGREYVVRRLIRRVVAASRIMGVEVPSVSQTVDTIVNEFGEYYPNLSQNRDIILQVLNGEINSFARTLDRSMRAMEKVINRMGDQKVMGGKEAFVLQDTHGLPLEVLEQILQERGLHVDREGFQREMSKQKEKSRSSRN